MTKFNWLEHYCGSRKLHWGTENGFRGDVCCWHWEERVELAAYQLKGVCKTWFKEYFSRRFFPVELTSLNWFEEVFLGCFIPRELKEANVREFFTLKQDSLSVHEYVLKFTELSYYAQEIVKDIVSRMSFVCCWVRLSITQRGSDTNVYWRNGHCKCHDRRAPQT